MLERIPCVAAAPGGPARAAARAHRLGRARGQPRAADPAAIPAPARSGAARRGRVRARHHRLDVGPDRRRQAQDLVDREPARERAADARRCAIALIAYRDRGDAYVTQVRDLTDDIDAVYADLQQLRRGRRRRHARVGQPGAARGGHAARVVERRERLPRDLPGRRRAAAPRLPGRRDVRRRASRCARQRGIVINTVQCGDLRGDDADLAADRERPAAARSPRSSRTAACSRSPRRWTTSSPRSTPTSRARSCPTARRPSRPSSRRSATAPRRASPSAVASRLGFLSKLGGRLNSGRADLLDAISSGEKKLADVAGAGAARPRCARWPRRRARSS